MFVIQKLLIAIAITSMISVLGIASADAGPCRNNDWQPTFVHDLDNEDGPWYVTPNGGYLKLRTRNNSWISHACDLIRQSGLRNRRGYTTCRAYTRVQCGCKRGISERNSACAGFLRQHRTARPNTRY